MSTPAARALDSAAGGGAPGGAGAGAPGGTSPGAGAGGGAPGQGAGAPGGAGKEGFWTAWKAPEQAEIATWAANKNYPDTFTLARTARDLEREAATLRQGKGYPAFKLDPQTKQPIVDPDTKLPVIDENERKAWRTLTGVPESADKYEIPVPENNPYPNFRTYMAEELLNADVPAAMAPRLAQGYERALQRLEAEQRQQEDSASELALKELERAWGPQYQERMALANRGKTWLASQAGGQGFSDLQMRVLESMLGTSNFLTAMWKLGAGNTEARSHGNDGGGGTRAFDGGASQAQARVDQIMADRTAGKINDRQWRETFGPEVDQLAQVIAKGMAPPPGLS
jgi:hypothetical protein